MGSPIRIQDLAQSLIRLCGKSEDSVPIKYTGLREGEKLEEELFYLSERVFSTSCEKIKRTRGPIKSWSELRRQLDELKIIIAVEGTSVIRAKLKQIVPEFLYDLSAVDTHTEQFVPIVHEKAVGQS